MVLNSAINTKTITLPYRDRNQFRTPLRIVVANRTGQHLSEPVKLSFFARSSCRAQTNFCESFYKSFHYIYDIAKAHHKKKKLILMVVFLSCSVKKVHYRDRGAQRTRWLDQVKRDLTEIGCLHG